VGGGLTGGWHFASAGQPWQRAMRILCCRQRRQTWRPQRCRVPWQPRWRSCLQRCCPRVGGRSHVQLDCVFWFLVLLSV
jgi:hypothetical protein